VQAGDNDFFLDETTSIADSSALHLKFSLVLLFLMPRGVAKYFLFPGNMKKGQDGSKKKGRKTYFTEYSSKCVLQFYAVFDCRYTSIIEKLITMHSEKLFSLLFMTILTIKEMLETKTCI
jgi:hypothetical protein